MIVPRGTLEGISLSEKAFKKNLYLRLFESGNIRHATAIQFASEDERRNSRQVVRGVPSFVHPNTVELQAAMPRAGAELRRRLALPPDAVLAGISGRLHPRKGFEIFVPAMAQCSSKIHLVAFGADEADYSHKIMSLAQESGVAGRVHLLGQLDGDSLQSAYASIDLLAMPSHGESFGNTAIEALAQGTEIMLSDRVPLGDWVTGHALGTVVPELNSGKWAAALDKWVARHETFDRARAARLVRREFDLKTLGRRLIDDYLRLLSSHDPTGRAADAGSET